MLQHHTVAQGTGVNENWPQVLDEYGVQFLVLDCRSDADLLEMFRSQPAWTIDFEDGEAVIFARTDTVHTVQ